MRTTIILAATVMLCSCGGNHRTERSDTIMRESTDTDHIIETEKGESVPDTEEEPVLGKSKDMVKADTILLNDGSRTVTISAFGPMNEYSITKDRRDRPKRILARASECDVQILTFVYDRQGRISKVNESYGNLDDAEDAKGACTYRFIYDGTGRLSEISRTSANQEEKEVKGESTVIKASEGYRLEGEFRPVVDFWESDLHGGRMEIVCREVANAKKGERLQSRVWIDFHEQEEPIGNAPAIGEAYLYQPQAIPFR